MRHEMSPFVVSLMEWIVQNPVQALPFVGALLGTLSASVISLIGVIVKGLVDVLVASISQKK